MPMSRRASVAVFFITALVASLVGLFVRGSNNPDLDVRILNAVQDIEFAGLGWVVDVSNQVAASVGAIITAMILIVIGAVARQPIFVTQIITLMALRLAGQLLKPTFDSPRPGLSYQRDPSIIWETFGYPSGHAFTATCIAGMVLLLAMHTNTRRWVHWLVFGMAMVFVMIAAFARVWVGAHWPSDTIGGILYGISAITLMFLLVSFISPRLSAQSSERP